MTTIRGKKKRSAGDYSFNIVDSLKKLMESIGIGKTGDNNGNDGNSNASLLRIAAVIFGAIYLGSGIYQVQHDERGIVLRFGKCVRTEGPGLQYRLPYPIESVIMQKVTTVKQIDVGSFFKGQHQDESLMLTGDLNLANISFSVLWKVKNEGVEDYLFNAKTPEIAVRAVAESVMREIVGQTTFSYVQTEGRADIQKRARESLQTLMDNYKIGVEILRIELQRVEPPASVVDSFRDVERAQAEQQSEKNNAEAYDRDTRARTRGLVAETINSGESMKRSIVETAKGSVARFLAAYSQYKLAPDIVTKRLYIETMRDIYKNVNKIIVDDAVKTLSHLSITELSKNKSKNPKENQI
jgi:membrane protease subunit HflK